MSSWAALSAGAGAADELLALVAPGLVRKAGDPLEERAFIFIVRELARDLALTAKQKEAKAIADAFDALDVNWPSLSDERRASALAQAEKIIARAGMSIAPDLVDVFAAHGKGIVASTKGAMIGRWDLPIAARLTGQDERIVDHASTSQALFITDQYGAIASAFGQQARDLVARGMRDGLSRNDIGSDLYGALGGVTGRTEKYFVNVASIFQARSRSYAQLASMEEAGIDEWEFSAVIDEVTCFAPDTRVLMANGHWRHISNVFGGDEVMSCKGRARRVVQQIEKTGRKWYTFTIDGLDRPLVVTHNHGILTARGWMRACSLGLGDQVALYRREGDGDARALWAETQRDWMARPGKFDGRTLNDVEPWPNPYLHRLGAFGAVRRIKASDITRRTPAFDLEVEDDAGYVAEGVIVHNSPICRMMDQRRFSVASSVSRYRDVAEAPPEAVRDLQPFVAQGRDDAGKEILYYQRGEERVRVAQIENSGLGRRDDRGKFSNVLPTAALEAAGISAPPLHGHCRSLIVPVGSSPAPAPAPQQPAPAPQQQQPAQQPAAAPPPRPEPAGPAEERALTNLDALHADRAGTVDVSASLPFLRKPAQDGIPYTSALERTGRTIEQLVAQHGERFEFFGPKDDLSEVATLVRRLDKETIARAVNEGPPVVLVRSGDMYYVHSGAERLAAVNLRDPKKKTIKAAAVLVDLDKIVPAERPATGPWARDLAARLDSGRPEDQARAREAIRAQIRGMGAVTRDDRRAASPGVDGWQGLPQAGQGANKLVAKPDSDPAMIGADATHTWNGAVTAKESIVERARSRLLSLANEPGFVARMQRAMGVKDLSMTFDGIRVLMHEELHGASKAVSSAYRGAGVGLEEAGTEILARKATRELLGLPDHRAAFPLPTKKKGGSYTGGHFCYRKYIEGVFNAVAEHTGDKAIHARVEDAFLATRKWGNGDVYRSPEDAARDFVANLRSARHPDGIPAETAARLVEQLTSKDGPMAR